jgi:phage FluMu protein Com
MSELLKAVATTLIEVNVECPHCSEQNDIFSPHIKDQMFEGREDDLFGSEEFDEEIKCDHCLNDFIISEIVY